MDYVQELVAGRIKFHELEKHVSKKEATRIRREAIEKITGAKLDVVGKCGLDPENLIGRNIENMIGSIQVPLGIAGPLRVLGDHANGDFYLPLATTEGALVASVNRGASVITKSGGAQVKIFDNKQTRGPCFRTENVRKAAELVGWVNTHFDEIAKTARGESKHLQLKKILPFVVGNNVFLRFEAETGDAMGMNMITIGTQKACEFIAKETGAEFVTISANICTDKKASAMNLILGRGKTVAADVIIPTVVVKDVLKTTPEKFCDIVYRKNLIGGMLAQTIGGNAHTANVCKSIFKATGQDLAHVIEGSLAITLAEERGCDLYVSITMPCLQVGTVGGGTRTETAQECLKILDCAGAGKALKFAEIVCAGALAGEISLLAAEAAHHLASAHQRLGR